jgi:hypothetical protein
VGCIINWSDEALAAIAAHVQGSDAEALGCIVQWDQAKLESELQAARSEQADTAAGGCIINW